MDYVLAFDILARLATVLSSPFTAPLSRVGLVVMATGWVIGFLAWRRYQDHAARGVRRYLRFAFPRHVYLSRSFALDLQLLFLNLFLGPARWLLGGLSVSVAAIWLSGPLSALIGPGLAPVPSTLSLAALALGLLLAYDFGTYVTHRLSHKVPVLWAFHRVHHSAETLNPLTLMRKHPVYDALAIVIDCLLVAPVQAVILAVWGTESGATVVLWSNLGFGMFALAASSLRHSHIWLSFGPVLNRILVSPAQHQIHHSKAPEHWDRNYGEVLAIWDWLFASEYLPGEREELRFGLAGEDRQPHDHIGAALLEPFGHAWNGLRRRVKLRRRRQPTPLLP